MKMGTTISLSGQQQSQQRWLQLRRKFLGLLTVIGILYFGGLAILGNRLPSSGSSARTSLTSTTHSDNLKNSSVFLRSSDASSSASNAGAADIPAAAHEALCSKRFIDADNLRSFVWSHRAHLPFNEDKNSLSPSSNASPDTSRGSTIPNGAHLTGAADGSKVVLGELLQAGVRNFDVDVSLMCSTLVNNSTQTVTPAATAGRSAAAHDTAMPLDNCRYVVAHPATLTDKTRFEQSDKAPQTVQNFLDQIYSYCSSKGDLPITTRNTRLAAAGRTLHPLISLEMKFPELPHRLRFIQELQRHPIAPRTVIIATDPLSLQAVLPLVARAAANNGAEAGTEAGGSGVGGVAAAYRSRPLSSSDYTWPFQKQLRGAGREDNSSNSTDTSAGQEEYLKSILTEVTVPASQQNYETGTVSEAREVRVDQRYIGRGESMVQVHMPDIQLIDRPVPRSPETHAGNATGPLLVVAWVVDDEATLWQALGRGVDGVISNRAPQLLKALQLAHARLCR